MASTIALRKAMLDRLVATGGPLEEPTLILFKNQVTPSKTTVMADLTEADFDGYTAQVALEFGTAFTGPLDIVQTAAPSLVFKKSAGAVSNTIWGWALVNAAKTVLHYAEAFEQPVVMLDTGDGLVVQPTVTWGE